MDEILITRLSASKDWLIFLEQSGWSILAISFLKWILCGNICFDCLNNKHYRWIKS